MLVTLFWVSHTSEIEALCINLSTELEPPCISDTSELEPHMLFTPLKGEYWWMMQIIDVDDY